tara:strand:- start:911 stop:1318 length:408 start_codon:yes stop_codon:yes gene_type:complete
MKKIRIIFILLLGIFLIGAGCNREIKPEVKPMVGGGCEYKTVPGKCKIISITENNNLNYGGYDVEFKFTANNTNKKIDGEYKRVLTGLNSTCIQNQKAMNKDLKACNFVKNYIFNCDLDIISTGTCNPSIFKFKD